MSRRLPFTKMVGTGNDFIIVESRRAPLNRLSRQWPTLSRALCDRRRGVGADGLLVLEPSRRADVRMRVFNPDGSEAQMCGNGARCVARYLAERSSRRFGRSSYSTVLVETGSGVLHATVEGARVAIGMPDPMDIHYDITLDVEGRPLHVDRINTGVPHAVIFVRSVDTIDVDRLGRILRQHRAFGPAGTNVDFVERHPMHPTTLKIRTYERGVEAETLACGTGVTASALVYVLRHPRLLVHSAKDRNAPAGTPMQIDVDTRSGDRLRVSCRLRSTKTGNRVERVVLEGPAQQVCAGTVPWPMRGEA